MQKLEKAILDRLERKSEHEYMWPRWAAAYEASEAAKEWFKELINSSEDGDLDFILFMLDNQRLLD